jgi:hypothetical protein
MYSAGEISKRTTSLSKTLFSSLQQITVTMAALTMAEEMTFISVLNSLSINLKMT